MFTLFSLYSRACKQHSLLHALQIQYSSSSRLGFSAHHFLLILPVVSFLLSHLALTQVQPASECVFIGIPKRFEKPCSVFTALKHLG